MNAHPQITSPALATRVVSGMLYPLTIAGAIGLFVLVRSLNVPSLGAAYAGVLLGAGVVTLFERLLPERREWQPNRNTVANDLAFMVTVQMLLPKFLSLLVALSLLKGLNHLGWTADHLWFHHWPLGLQVIAMILLADFFRYWLHVACHRYPLLWRLHAVHHSPPQLYWLNVGRFHPLEKSMQFLCDALPFILVSVSPEVLSLYFVFYAVNGFFQHCNIRLRLGWLNYLISGPELHRWHHSKIIAESNANYGNNLIVWDVLFSTRFLPKGRSVGDLGLRNPHYPLDFRSQFRTPFVPDLDHARIPASSWRDLALNAGLGLAMHRIRLFVFLPIHQAALDPGRKQKQVLKRILARHRHTQFGRDHHLSAQMDLDAYRAQVPLTDYDQLEPYIQKQEETGEPSLNPKPPVLFNVTSGTTGKAKYLPVLPETLRAARRNQQLFLYLQYRACPHAYRGGLLGIVSPPIEGHLSTGTPYGSASGWVYAGMHFLAKIKYVLPTEVFGCKDYLAKYYATLRLSLAHRDITYMATANPSTFLRLLDLLTEHRESLLKDIAEGTFQHLDAFTEDQQRVLKRLCRPDPRRAQELETALSKTPSADFPSLWPHLRAVSTWTGGSCGIALTSLQAKLAPDTVIMDLGYLASEVRATITVDFENQDGLPTFWENFFEFVERDSWESGQANFLTLDQLVVGSSYYIFLTTPSGLFRYPMNDIVEVTGHYRNTPLLKFQQKGIGVTNITGEKVHECQAIAAVRNVELSRGFRFRYFQWLADEDASQYRLYLELEVQEPLDLPALTTEVDDALADLNLEYQEKRRSGRLRPPLLLFLKPGTLERYKSWCLDQGIREAQFKTVSLRYQRDFPFDLDAHLLKSPLPDQLPMLQLRLYELRIPLKITFRHASASRNTTESLWVETYDGRSTTGYGESCPRSYVTGETFDTCRQFLATHGNELQSSIRSMDDLRSWTAAHAAEIDQAPAAWCALELALIDLLARQQNCSWEALLGLPELEGCFQYTAVLGDQDDASFAAQLDQYRSWGFEDFKIKLSGDPDRDARKFEHLDAAGVDASRVRLDANNLWTNPADAATHLGPFTQAFAALEEPLQPNAYAEMRRLSSTLGKPIILDESFLRLDQFAEIESDPATWWINLRVSKMGGLLRSLEVVQQARQLGIPMIIGAQVGETSILTRAALPIARQATGILKGQEGACGTHLLEQDVQDPPLMFGAGGRIAVVDYPDLRRPLPIHRPLILTGQ